MAIGTFFKAAGKTVGMIAKNYGPQILVGTGVVLKTAEVVTACIQTTKLNEKLDECNARLEAVPVDEDGVQDKKELRKAYVKNCGTIAKLYALPASLGLVGDIAILGGFGIVDKRLMATTTAYAALQESYAALVSKTETSLDKDKKVNYTIEQKDEDGKALVVSTEPAYVTAGLPAIVLDREFWPEWCVDDDRNIQKITDYMDRVACELLKSRLGMKTRLGAGAYITINEIARGFNAAGGVDIPNGFNMGIFYDENVPSARPIQWKIEKFISNQPETESDIEWAYRIVFENARDINTEIRRKRALARKAKFDMIDEEISESLKSIEE